MNIDKFTEKAREAVVAAQRDAEDRNQSQIEAEHLLYALLDQSDGVAPQILSKLNIEPAVVKSQVVDELDRLPRMYGGTGQAYLSQGFNRVLRAAEKEADRIKDEFISTEHLLIAIADEGYDGPGGRILRSLGVSKDKIFDVLTKIRGGQRVTDPDPESKYQALSKAHAASSTKSGTRFMFLSAGSTVPVPVVL